VLVPVLSVCIFTAARGGEGRGLDEMYEVKVIRRAHAELSIARF